MIERKDLGGIEQPAGVEHRAHAHLLIKIYGSELEMHEIALFDSHPMFAGEASAHLHAELENIVARLFRLGLFGLDKLKDVPASLARLEAAFDQVF